MSNSEINADTEPILSNQENENIKIYVAEKITDEKPDENTTFFTAKSTNLSKKYPPKQEKRSNYKIVAGKAITEPETRQEIKASTTTNKKLKQNQQEQPGPSGLLNIVVSDGSITDEDDQDDDNTLCCVCNMWQPKELQDCISIVFTQWAKCELLQCDHWTHLKFCCDVSVLYADNIQNRTIRYFLGVHRFAPTLALHGDVGWIPSQFRRWTNMVRYWNRLLKFEDDRITKLAFNADYNRCTDNWCSELKDILCKLNLKHYFDSKTAINLKTVEMNIQHLYSNIWNDNIQQVPKLRTYITFKSAFNQEQYVKINLTKVERSHLAQFRCGILPLRIETGRYIGERPEERLQILHCRRDRN
ncbi:unnamed protein product [Mytilus coruscus]|uniref:Uncharacterized protein n=1 Tax=Mytilus coruscus TaxID=42192 RepID=A0A6J8CGT1_MYTCO|nr:unnamed protein product [Mytilus coruscus]